MGQENRQQRAMDYSGAREQYYAYYRKVGLASRITFHKIIDGYPGRAFLSQFFHCTKTLD